MFLKGLLALECLFKIDKEKVKIFSFESLKRLFDVFYIEQNF